MHKKAVALRYDKTKMHAPVVEAKGEGRRAQKIIEIAQEHGVEIYEDADLVELLSQVPYEKEIPEQLYEVVAKILAFVYKKKKAYMLKGVQNG